jgi:hypothetical protein
VLAIPSITVCSVHCQTNYMNYITFSKKYVPNLQRCLNSVPNYLNWRGLGTHTHLFTFKLDGVEDTLVHEFSNLMKNIKGIILVVYVLKKKNIILFVHKINVKLLLRNHRYHKLRLCIIFHMRRTEANFHCINRHQLILHLEI